MEWVEQPDGSWSNPVTGATRWEPPSALAARRSRALDQGAAEPSAVHEELEILGENRDDLRYELRFSDMFAMDLAPNYDAAHQRSAFVQIDLPAQRFQSEAMPCAEATCIWQHNELRIDADEATWRGICDAADSGADELRVSVWASFSGGDQKDAKLGEACVTPRTLRSAIGTEVTVSLNLTRSKKKKAPEEAGTLDLALFVERSGPVSEATAKADALPPDPALLVERGGWEPGDDEAAKEDTNPDAWLQVRRRAFRAILNRQ